jgi:hypothetical protein
MPISNSYGYYLYMDTQSLQRPHCVLRMEGHVSLTDMWADIDTSECDEDEDESILARISLRYFRRKRCFSAHERRLGIEVFDVGRDLNDDTAPPELISYSFEEFLVRSYFTELMKWYEDVDDPLPEHVREYMVQVYTQAGTNVDSGDS